MAARFDTSGERLFYPTASFTAPTTVTFGGWIYMDADRATFTYPLGFDDASGSKWLLIGFANGHTLELSTDLSGGGVITPVTFTTGTWHYVAAVCNSAGTDYIYHANLGDTTLTQYAAGGGGVNSPDDANDFSIGSDSFGEWMNGRCAYVRMWTGALSQAELEAEMVASAAVRTTNLFGDWDLTSNGNDISGNARHLTTSGSVSYVANPTLAASPPDTPETPILDSAWNGAIHGFLLNAPADNGGTITGYKWQTAPQVAGSPGTPTLASGQTSMELNASGLTNGTPYYARVAATNVGGDSSYSSWAGPITPTDLGEFDRISSTQSVLLGTGNALRLENFPATYPVSVDATNRYIKDQNGNPWLCAGDTAWSIVAALSTTDISTYVANRRAKGVTAVIASFPEPWYAPNAPNNLAGQSPFTGSAFASSLNNSYWTVVDHFLNECKTAGITVFACWFYLGYVGGGDGWYPTIDGVTTTNMRSYADAIYARYPPSTYPHIVHFLGHDRVPSSTQQDKGLAFIDQLRNVNGDTRLFIYGGVHDRDVNGTDTFGIGAEDWATAAATMPPDIHTQYDYSQWNILNADTMAGFSPTRPHLFIEGIYDEEQGNGTGTLLTRSQLWGPWADGGIGGFVGINPIWNFENKTLFGYTFGWKPSMDLKGSLIIRFFRWIVGNYCQGWQDTVCDIASAFVTNRGSSGTRVAARFNNRFGIVYVKDYTAATWPLTLNLSNFTAWSTVKITRVDPMNGERVIVDASESISNTAFALASPGTTNSDGATDGKDWLFLVEGVS